MANYATTEIKRASKYSMRPTSFLTEEADTLIQGGRFVMKTKKMLAILGAVAIMVAQNVMLPVEAAAPARCFR